MLFNSNPVEFGERTVVLDISGKRQEIPNDLIWVFAGGTPPTEFLKKIGVRFGTHDMTLEGSKEVRQAAEAKELTPVS